MSSASPMAERPSARLLRPPAQIPFFVCEVTLNIAGIAFILRTAVIVPFLPERLQTQRSLARRQRGLTARQVLAVRRSVRHVMTTRVVSVLPDAPVSRAVDLMRRYGFSALPVTNTRYHLVGMISLLDVIRLRESQPWAADDARVEEVMTSTRCRWRPPRS